MFYSYLKLWFHMLKLVTYFLSKALKVYFSNLIDTSKSWCYDDHWEDYYEEDDEEDGNEFKFVVESASLDATISIIKIPLMDTSSPI